MLSTPHPRFRLFVLGAGFSQPAGLPVAAELYAAVDFVRKGEAEGKTPDQITDELQAMRQQSEKATQEKIDRM